MTLDQLDYLTPAELIILEEHLKLGAKHLKSHLSEKEFKQLVMMCSLNKDQTDALKKTEAEITGNLTLVLNTIFTAIFGAWLGYSGFLGVNIASFWKFGTIVLVATLTGLCIGYQNVQLTKQLANESALNQKFHVLQIRILKKIKQKRYEEIDALMLELDQLFAVLDNKTPFSKLAGQSQKKLSEWTALIDHILEQKLAWYKQQVELEGITDVLSQLKEELNCNLVNYFHVENRLDCIHYQLHEPIKGPLEPYLKKLTSTSPRQSTESPSWLKSNKRSLIIGLAPTLLGGFSSLSVYLGGIPHILKSFGHEQLFLFFTNPPVKKIEFFISLLITLYLGFSFLYANHKIFKRMQELAKTAKTIVQRESSLTILDAYMLKLKNLKNIASHIKLTCHFLDQVVEKQNEEVPF